MSKSNGKRLASRSPARNTPPKPARAARKAAAKPAVQQVPEHSAPAGVAALRLEPSCTLREAADLHFSMLAIRQEAAPLAIDAGAVERIDTAGLQLLASLARARVAAGGTLNWVAVSPELARCAARLGLEQTLALPAESRGDVS